VFFRQVLHADLGCASYVIADTRAGAGAVVDPRFDVAEYLELAREHGFAITDVVETHNHADHLSGRGRLVEATGARVRIHRLADAAYDHVPFEDGDEFPVGQSVVLRVLHTPGHRPEHAALVVVDLARGPEPCAVLTGDSLFVNDVARPDLAVEKRQGAAELFDSLARLVELGDAVEVYPGHTGGSLCGSARMSEKTSSTIGYERAHNPLLLIAEQEGFVDTLVSGLSPQPPNFAAIAETNRAQMPTELHEPVALAPHRFAERIAAGGIVVDGRAPEAFAAGHIPGGVGVTLAATGFGTKVAWLADGEHELLLVGHDDADAERMAGLLGAVGIRSTGARLAGGFSAWRAAGLGVATLEIVAARDLPDLVASRPEVQLLDVRADHEWEDLRIPGSAHVPFNELRARMPDLEQDRPVAAFCSSGKRAAMAVGLLQRGGFEHVIHINGGGIRTWEQAGMPLERERPVAAA
jgi:hydroxyacylglutathione hydrolase